MSDVSRDGSGAERDVICGRNAVREALLSGRSADALYVAAGERTGSILPIIAIAKDRGVPVKEVDPKKIARMCYGQTDQGVALQIAAHKYSTVDAMLASASDRGEPPFLVILDGIEDPHNLGAVIRSAECCGAHGVIITERRSVGLTSAVAKTSAGAVEYVPVARVKNLTRCVKELQQKGLWVWAADAEGTDMSRVDLSGPVALVIGSEGSGVSELVKKTCDGCVALRMKGRINSLNASVAAGILMYAVSDAQNKKTEK